MSRVLVIGGSGYAPSLMIPGLAESYTVRVLDPRPPSTECEYLAGDATDPTCLAKALDGVDVLVHAATGSHGRSDPARAASQFTVNVTSVHLALAAAHDAGIRHAVHISSLSVFRNVTGRRVDESTRPDADDPYGLSKRLGEEVCRAAARRWRMSVTVLRLAFPTPDVLWPAWGYTRPPTVRRATNGKPIHATAASDLARAVAAAIEHRNGFQLFHITGDDSAGLWSIERARTVLGWQPTFRIRPEC
jgi:nucleoside-diphosphate-sugar epimerase